MIDSPGNATKRDDVNLEQILRLANDQFHSRTTGKGGHGETVSMKGLIPIHRSLLEIAAFPTNPRENDAIMTDGIDQESTWLRNFLVSLGSKKNCESDKMDEDCEVRDDDRNLKLCERILRSESVEDSNDFQKLLVWQYLLFRARLVDSLPAMEWTSLVIFSYLLPLQREAASKGERSAYISDELMNVVLELSLEWAFSETSSPDPGNEWSEIRRELLAATMEAKNKTISSLQKHDVLEIPLSSTIAAKIVLQYISTEDQRDQKASNDLFKFFLSLYFEQLWCNLQLCCINSSVSLLSDFSKRLLLPLLEQYETNSSINSHEADLHYKGLHQILWTKLFPLLQKEGVLDSDYGGGKGDKHVHDRTTHLLLVVTTTLCPLLPWYWKHPSRQRREKEHSQYVWNLIFVCLKQGRRSVVEARKRDAGRGKGNKGVFGNGGPAAMLRRRALYLLDVVTSPPSNDAGTKSSPLYSLWREYVLCADTFEMEGERHIIDQIWPVVAKLIEEAWKNKLVKLQASVLVTDEGVPKLTPPWIELLLGRLLSSEQLAVRKLGIFRILEALGRPVTTTSLLRNMKDDLKDNTIFSKESIDSSMDITSSAANNKNLPDNVAPKKKRETTAQKNSQHPKKKKKTSRQNSSLDVLPTEMLLRTLSPDTFLWDVLVPSWDSLGGSSVGYTIHLVDNTKVKGSRPSGSPVEKFSKVDMVPLFSHTIRNYCLLASTLSSENMVYKSTLSASSFWKGMWDWDRVGRHLSARTYLSVYKSVTDLIEIEKQQESDMAMSVDGRESTVALVPMDDEDLKAIRETYVNLFRNGLMVLSQRTQFINMLSLMLSKASATISMLDGDCKTSWTPINVLSIVALFSASYFPSLNDEQVVDWAIESEEMLLRITHFIREFDSQNSCKTQQPFITSVGATLATAFVTGQGSHNPNQGSLSLSSTWNPVEGLSPYEQEMGWAVSLFCTMAVSKTSRTSGELLWPAIFKGLSQAPGVLLTRGSHPKGGHVARALLLLENGCRLRQLSGLGNGDLVVNPKTNQIMPPPPNIEKILLHSADFLQWQLRQLLATESHRECDENNRKRKRFTGSFAFLISQLRILHRSFPSSSAISGVMDELLEKTIKDLSFLLESQDASTCKGDVQKLLLVGLIHGACSCGAKPKQISLISLCRLLLHTRLSTSGEGLPDVWVKSSRSIIQYGRWAALLYILDKLLESHSSNSMSEAWKEINQLINDVLDEGIACASITPSDAIKPLFDCIIKSSREWIRFSSECDRHGGKTKYLDTLTEITKTLVSLVKQSTRSRESALMLNEFCALIFQPKLLNEEYERITNNPTRCRTPIRDSFRQLIKLAGRQRPQITRAALCRITIGWLGDCDSVPKGLSAIPYREDIIQLLLHKEVKQEESSSNQSKSEIPASGVTEIPTNTNELSITRAFLLVFFSQLPDPGSGLNAVVEKDLLHFVILELLRKAAPERGTHPSLVMKGTPKYCMKMRGWQALCILSRFVTKDIAAQVCEMVFQSMNELLHNQIRYFLENFTIRCATMHSAIFGEAFLKDISRTDLSLQHISSLMIMGGNFIMGKYQLDYLSRDDTNNTRSKLVLAGVLPWLSSTQGFSRAIAQVMVYQLIPRVIDIKNNGSDKSLGVSDNESNWFLRSTYNFLRNNREMKRLRSKQTKFFEQYDCESMCTVEGVFSIPVDEAEEADPIHMIDAMKESLRNTYSEAHESDAPSWKHVEEMLLETSIDLEGENLDNNFASTVQRKIIPLDSLNLALEDCKKQRAMNVKGTRKQNLIVCASLVDKVPNLAGLARTCEIFAAQSLVVPDMSVSKMDNFQSISVGAVDWIDLEEVKEEALLSWLLQKKTEGFWVVGLEQTSSSVPLNEIKIPDYVSANNKTVLLLGKEREGIPVQYLQAVDTCIEIPQFGLIRSLNVHVSGAITIWELTRRTRLMESKK